MDQESQIPQEDRNGEPTEAPRVWASAVGRLSRDWVLWVASFGLVLVVVPYLIPVFTEDAQWWWDNIWVNLILHSSAVLALTIGVSRIQSRAERLFWRLMASALACVLIVNASWAISEAVSEFLAQSVGMELFSQICYMAFYLLIAFALDAHRTVDEERVDQKLHWTRAVGLGILLAGFMAYFAVTPVLVYRTDPVVWTPILLIYASLDLLLCLQALRVRSSSTDKRWRRILGWMALALGAYAVGDFMEAADYAGWMDVAKLGWFGELQWYLPIGALILGARIHLTQKRKETEVPSDGSVLLQGGPLVAYALVLPVLHFLFYSLDIFDPELRVLREVVVLAVVAIIGVLAFIYEKKIHFLNWVTHVELEASRERYSTFVETSVEGIWLLEFDPPVPTSDPLRSQVAKIFLHGSVAESNDAMALMHGFDDAAEVEGKPLREILQGVKNSERNAEATGRFVASGYRVKRETLELADSHGNPRYVEGSMVGVVEAGLLTQAWATQVDVTARVVAEAEKERLEDQLRRSQRLETIGTLAGGIAHDFNNILAPILGFAELAECSTPVEDTETRESLGQIKIASHRAKELVSQILAVGQKRDNVREPVAVRDIVEEAQNLLRKSLPSTVRFETDFEVDCPPALADPSQLHQIVMNLCTNANQAMEKGGGVIRLGVFPTRLDHPPEDWLIDPGDYVVLSVADNGPGMPSEVFNRAFEPFFTTKEFGSGSGLGLSVTHGIVRGHQGHIELETEAGVGTKLSIYLPVSREPVKIAPVRSEKKHQNGKSDPEGLPPVPRIPSMRRVRVPPPVVAPASKGAPPAEFSEGSVGSRVMLVDDEANVARTCEAMLTRMGYDVLTFTDSSQALDRIRTGPKDFDLLVTDHTMPDVTGPQLAEMALEGNPAMAIVIASGHRFGDQLAAGGNVVQLGKPFSMAELRASVETALGSCVPQ